MNEPRVVAFVFARGGSKGVPGKNLRLLGGVPLLGRAIETARACSRIDRVVVSTDDEAIAACGREYGADVPFMRPAELGSDSAPEWLAWQHALKAVRAQGDPVDVLLSVPATCPLRGVGDVEACLERLLGEPDADIALTVTEPTQNPYFNMVAFDPLGRARVALESPNGIHRRQDAPPIKAITAVAYAARAEFVLTANRMFDGSVIASEVPPERAVDIDTELDLAFAEFLFERESSRR